MPIPVRRRILSIAVKNAGTASLRRPLRRLPIPDDLASRENADQGVAERPREAARRRTTVKNGRESRNPLSN
ncbi:hypothetical protein, partial [Gordonibacter sp. 28C]|uniref:hypothetical protein n=1 Tax=Gordonibacter sp. 28C TaxID=2078569 RepID=UPI001A7E140D